MLPFRALPTLLMVVALAPAVRTAQEVSIAGFGIVPNDTRDAGPAVRKAVAYLAAHPGTTLVFPGGDYHFSPAEATDHELFLSNTDVVNPRHVAIYLEGLEHVRIVGRGARLLFRDRILPLVIRRSRDIEVAGFEIDWPRPLMSQGGIVAADAGGITLRIDAREYPYVVEDGRLLFVVEGRRLAPWDFMEFDPEIHGVAPRTGDDGCLGRGWQNYRAVEMSPGLVRLEFPFTRLPKVGNVLVARHGVRDHAGTFIEDSSHVTIADMEYRHTSGLGVLAQYSSDLTFSNVHFRPAPASTRQFSGHDDGFHFSNCKGQIVVERCSFFGLMDDCINVHGTSVNVVGRRGPRTFACRFMHEQSVGLKFGEAGDELSLIDRPSMLSIGTARITAIRRRDVREFEVDVDRDVADLPPGGLALENLTWTPAVTVRDNLFGGVRARGLLVTTPRATLVDGNTFRSSGAAITISGDANGWYESGAVDDVTIRGNRFDACNTSRYQFSDAVITISPEIPRPGPLPFHHHIRIVDNTFVVTDVPILWAFSVGGLEMTGNRVDVSPRYDAFHANAHGLTVLSSEDVRVRNNILSPSFTGRSVRVEGGRPETIAIDGWR